MKLATIYAWYSSERQTEQSIEGQLDVCKKYAEQNGLQIVDTYIDRAMTGTNDNRAAFQQMLADSEKAAWEIVLVYAIDRFGRNSIEVAVNKQKLQKNHKILISATQRMSVNIDGTKNLDGILLENVLIGLSEYYSAELAQKIRRGLTESRKKGLFCGGGLPYGYKTANKKVLIEDDTAAVINYIFQQYSIGVVVPKIVEELKAKGIVNHDGKFFSKNGIYNILKNEKYAGVYRHGGEVYDNIYPRIVPVETYDKVRSIVNKNKFGKRSIVTVYLLRYKVKCGYCGSSISAECGTGKNGQKKHYYACIGRKKHRNGCEKSAVRKEIIEQLVLDTLVQKLSQPDVMDKMVNRLMQIQAQQATSNPMLNIMMKEKKQVDTALENLVSALENGISSQTTNKRLHELEAKRDILESSILIEQSKTIVSITEREIREYYQEALELDPTLLINTLIKEITLYNDKIIIQLNSPLRTSPDESQGFSFYSAIVKMQKIVQNKTDLVYIDFEVIMRI